MRLNSLSPLTWDNLTALEYVSLGLFRGGKAVVSTAGEKDGSHLGKPSGANVSLVFETHHYVWSWTQVKRMNAAMCHKTRSRVRIISGSAMTSMLTTLSLRIAKTKTPVGRPPGAHTAPGEPLTSAGSAPEARPAKVRKTADAPRSSSSSGGAPNFARIAVAFTATLSARKTTSGCKMSRSASKSPSRDAERKASTTWR